MNTPLLPQAFWFRLALPCRRIDDLPRRRSKGPLLDLPESCRLPETTRLEGQPALADVRVAWNPKGLAVAVEVIGKTGPIVHDRLLPEASDGLQLWIDTRDTRDIHRASRFCHHYSATLNPSRLGLTVDFRLRPIHRAQADPPGVQAEKVLTAAQKTRHGWRLEVFLVADALHGFDPETNRRLGFAYQVTDPGRGDQFLGVGRDFPIGEDPSLWSTLELRDDPA